MTHGGTRVGMFGQQRTGVLPGFSPADLEPVFWVDAALSSVSGGKLTNLGTGGSALDAQFGSTTGVDTNDPTVLSHTGVNYLYCPGVAGNGASIPDEAALDITGDIDVAVRVRLTDWTPAATQNFIGKRDASASWVFRVVSTGRLEIAWWTATVPTVAQVVGASPFVDDTTYWIRFTLDVDNGAGGSTTRFFYAADQSAVPTSWTQYGADVVTAGVTSIDAGTSPLYMGIGSSGVSDPMIGGLYRCIVKNGINGTTVADVDFTRLSTGAETSFTATTGQTVTINRATSGRKAAVVVRPTILLGTDDYFTVPDNALVSMGTTQDFTALVVVRQWATATGFPYMGHNVGGSPIVGWNVGPSRALIVGDGVVQPVTASDPPAAGVLTTFGGVRVGSASKTLTPYKNGVAGTPVTDTTTATLDSAGALVIGKDPGAALYQDMEFAAAAIFRRALTAAEIAAVNTFYGTA